MWYQNTASQFAFTEVPPGSCSVGIAGLYPEFPSLKDKGILSDKTPPWPITVSIIFWDQRLRLARNIGQHS